MMADVADEKSTPVASPWRGLSLLQRTNVPGCWTLASFHHPDSLMVLGPEFCAVPRGREARLADLQPPRSGAWTLRVPFVGDAGTHVAARGERRKASAHRPR